MNLRFPLILCLFFLSLMSCRHVESKNSNDSIPIEIPAIDSAYPQMERHEKSNRLKKEKTLVTQTGKRIKILEYSENNGLNTLHIIPIDFEHSKDTLRITDVDPVQKILLDDLDNNSYDELYLVTVSSGSGSYANVYGFASNKDLSVTPIYFPEPSEADLAPKGKYHGYMGHDSIYFKNNKLHRKFPVYKEGDPNCCPTGGKKTLIFKLVQGEASWLLIPDD